MSGDAAAEVPTDDVPAARYVCTDHGNAHVYCHQMGMGLPPGWSIGRCMVCDEYDGADLLRQVAAREAAAQAEIERWKIDADIAVEVRDEAIKAERDAAYQRGLDAAVKAIETLVKNPDQQSEQVANTRLIGLLMAVQAVRAIVMLTQ